LSTRGPSVPERAFAVEVAAPSPGYGQMVLTTDEAGVMSWSFAAAPDAANAREYLVRQPVPAVDETAPAQRGLIGAIGKKVIKILAFKLADEVLGAVGEHFARKWEEEHRPYRLRSFGPEDALTPGSPLEGPGWERLRGKRALLLVHGTFSRAHSAFGALPAPVLTALQERYPGGVIAFDHFTLSEDPRANVERLVRLLPPESSLDVDVLTHSRGGLVARVLAERFGDIDGDARSVRIGRVVFVGTPNGGTVLADAEHVGDLIDTYTNVLNFLPDNGVTEVLDGIITVAKVIAVGTIGGLDGIGSMVRDGPFLRDWLNGAGGEQAEYYAIASDYEPADRGLRDFAKDRLTDALFGEHNDLVVPTGGVGGANGANGFPIADPLMLDASAAVGHTRYFADDQVQDRLLHWLRG
jgi:pimeloyl-ACP methyl ester carboxylesterase